MKNSGLPTATNDEMEVTYADFHSHEQIEDTQENAYFNPNAVIDCQQTSIFHFQRKLLDLLLFHLQLSQFQIYRSKMNFPN